MTELNYFATTLHDQAPALALLAGLAGQHPTLPAAYFVASYAEPNKVTAQLGDVVHVEAWREALGVPAESVLLEPFGRDSMALSFTAIVNAVPVEVWVSFLLAKAETEGASA